MENEQEAEEKYTVLLIEDEKWAREVMENYVRQSPWFILQNVAKTGTEAYRYLTRNRYDLVFMDIILPGMNGIKILSELPYSANVIFTTVKRDFALKAFEIGVIDYLLKPISPERFEIAANRALEVLRYRKMGHSFSSPKQAAIKAPNEPEIHLEEHLQSNYSLTSQEALICKHLYDGYSRDEIKELLDISNQTLKQHLRSVFAKTIDLDAVNPSKKHGKMHMLINFLIRQMQPEALTDLSSQGHPLGKDNGAKDEPDY